VWFKFQKKDSNKIKSAEKKTMGYLPRVLFFNAFELGAVICKDAHVGVIRLKRLYNFLCSMLIFTPFA
jgi:hypothetical protein